MAVLIVHLQCPRTTMRLLTHVCLYVHCIPPQCGVVGKLAPARAMFRCHHVPTWRSCCIRHSFAWLPFSSTAMWRATRVATTLRGMHVHTPAIPSASKWPREHVYSWACRVPMPPHGSLGNPVRAPAMHVAEEQACCLHLLCRRVNVWCPNAPQDSAAISHRCHVVAWTCLFTYLLGPSAYMWCHGQACSHIC